MGLKFKTRVPKNPSKSKSHSNDWFINHHVPQNRGHGFLAHRQATQSKKTRKKARNFTLPGGRADGTSSGFAREVALEISEHLGTKTTSWLILAHLGMMFSEMFLMMVIHFHRDIK